MSLEKSRYLEAWYVKGKRVLSVRIRFKLNYLAGFDVDARHRDPVAKKVLQTYIFNPVSTAYFYFSSNRKCCQIQMFVLVSLSTWSLKVKASMSKSNFTLVATTDLKKLAVFHSIGYQRCLMGKPSDSL